jgi:hypothetical protein
LVLNGNADISRVMIKVSESCYQLVDLNLAYDGQINGVAMRNLLQSCPLVKSLTTKAFIDVQAYEHLAVYGGNLTKLTLIALVRNGQ